MDTEEFLASFTLWTLRVQLVNQVLHLYDTSNAAVRTIAS